MRAFIIRPLGRQKDARGREIDFDRVEADLIAPALERVGVTGGTTLDIFSSGHIRAEMFQRLLTADLIVADLSAHDAYVFYELGIRHALRDKRTLMLHSGPDSFPFHLLTDCHLAYDRLDPAASLDALAAALRRSINSEAQDSPVFKLLPSLRAPDGSHLLAVPLDFREEAERALAAGRVGDLTLLADELEGFEWESEGLRVLGRALCLLGADRAAAEVWEQARKLDPLDTEANTRLGGLGQRLGDLTRAGAEAQARPGRVILFTGHMIDAPGRKQPRFPPGKEGAARRAIRAAVEQEVRPPGGVAYGIAGGASGGDILFHEVCAELGVPTGLFLALPRDEYVRQSVRPAGPLWVERFLQLYDAHEPRVLIEAQDEAEYLPRWLREKADYNIWQRTNLWMLHNALAAGEGGLTVIALWDGKAGDGAGGTDDLVQRARGQGAKTVILDPLALPAGTEGAPAAAGGAPDESAGEIKAVEVVEATPPTGKRAEPKDEEE